MQSATLPDSELPRLLKLQWNLSNQDLYIKETSNYTNSIGVMSWFVVVSMETEHNIEHNTQITVA